MPDYADLAVVLLAAGAGTRFGGNKLEANFGDVMLGEAAAHTLAALPVAACFAVHDPAHHRLGAALATLGYTLVANPNVARGQSHSLALGVAAAEATRATALLVALADMPFITPSLIDALFAVSLAHPDRCIAANDGTAPMPPAIFPRRCWAELKGLTGDSGARRLLRGAEHVDADPMVLRDVDMRSDLAGLV